MVIILKLVFDPWDVQFLKWRHQNLLGANTKGKPSLLQVTLVIEYDGQMTTSHDLATLRVSSLSAPVTIYVAFLICPHFFELNCWSLDGAQSLLECVWRCSVCGQDL
ncbi:hypothetical protein Hdeb2414_s0010g00350611 [Helianthus debilis subsp. tardiflorus]